MAHLTKQLRKKQIPQLFAGNRFPKCESASGALD